MLVRAGPPRVTFCTLQGATGSAPPETKATEITAPDKKPRRCGRTGSRRQ
jgi:hypothetical protein